MKTNFFNSFKKTLLIAFSILFIISIILFMSNTNAYASSSYISNILVPSFGGTYETIDVSSGFDVRGKTLYYVTEGQNKSIDFYSKSHSSTEKLNFNYQYSSKEYVYTSDLGDIKSDGYKFTCVLANMGYIWKLEFYDNFGLLQNESNSDNNISYIFGSGVYDNLFLQTSKPVTYTVNYYVDSNLIHVETEQFTMPSFNAPLKSGFNFSGWYGNSSFTEYVPMANSVLTSDVNCYAKYVSSSAGKPLTDTNTDELNQAFNSEFKIEYSPYNILGKTVYVLFDSSSTLTINLNASVTVSSVMFNIWSNSGTNIVQYNFSGVTSGTITNNLSNYFSYELNDVGERKCLVLNFDKNFGIVDGYYDSSNPICLLNSIKENGITALNFYVKVESGYSVNYYDGSNLIHTEEAQTTLPDYTAPKKDGYTFDGWYLESYYETEILSGTELTKDTSIYAKYTKDVESIKESDKTSASESEKGDFFDTLRTLGIPFLVVGGIALLLFLILIFKK